MESNLRAAQLLFERAVEREPGFALAHAALADVHQRMAWFRYDTSAERVARIRDEADTALRLAPMLPQAHAAKALVHYSAGDYRLSIGELDTALEAQPGDAELLGYKGYAHRRLGTLDEALAAFASASGSTPAMPTSSGTSAARRLALRTATRKPSGPTTTPWFSPGPARGRRPPRVDVRQVARRPGAGS